MRRRAFISLLGGAAAWPLVARAQPPTMPVVGFFHIASANAYGHVTAALRRGLADTDFFEGRNVAIEYRWAEGQPDRLPALAADLLRRQPALIVAGATTPTQALRSANADVPIVVVTADDPVKLGWVESLNRPGGNMTGVYLLTSGLEAKRLGLLRDVVAGAKTIGVLLHTDYSTSDVQLHDVREAAARLGVQLVETGANTERDFDAAFATLVEKQVAALLVGASPFFNDRRNALVALAARHKLPAIYEWREFAVAGGLISYGHSLVESYRQAGAYAGRILKGTKPADLPVVQPTRFELVLNLRTAKSLGLTISDNLLTLADEVIE
jgi:putative tryptophan/tyrosine transport system substrate-binding protein